MVYPSEADQLKITGRALRREDSEMFDNFYRERALSRADEEDDEKDFRQKSKLLSDVIEQLQSLEASFQKKKKAQSKMSTVMKKRDKRFRENIAQALFEPNHRALKMLIERSSLVQACSIQLSERLVAVFRAHNQMHTFNNWVVEAQNPKKGSEAWAAEYQKHAADTLKIYFFCEMESITKKLLRPLLKDILEGPDLSVQLEKDQKGTVQRICSLLESFLIKLSENSEFFTITMREFLIQTNAQMQSADGTPIINYNFLFNNYLRPAIVQAAPWSFFTETGLLAISLAASQSFHNLEIVAEILRSYEHPTPVVTEKGALKVVTDSWAKVSGAVTGLLKDILDPKVLSAAHKQIRHSLVDRVEAFEKYDSLVRFTDFLEDKTGHLEFDLAREFIKQPSQTLTPLPGVILREKAVSSPLPARQRRDSGGRSFRTLREKTERKLKVARTWADVDLSFIPKFAVESLSQAEKVQDIQGPPAKETASTRRAAGDCVNAWAMSTFASTTKSAFPLSDRFHVQLYQTENHQFYTICVVHGSSSHGPMSAYTASELATSAFSVAASSAVHKNPGSTADLAVALLDGFKAAHTAIREKTPAGEKPGNVMLLGAFLVKLKDQPNYALICASIGDIKALSIARSRITDITNQSRARAQDLHAPSGMLGPVFKSGEPDLSNLVVYYKTCKPGAMLLFLTPMLAWNMHPRYQNTSPRVLHLPFDTWESAFSASPDEAENTVAKYRSDLIKERVLDKLETLDPNTLTHRVVDVVMEITAALREFAVKNEKEVKNGTKEGLKGRLGYGVVVSLAVGMEYKKAATLPQADKADAEPASSRITLANFSSSDSLDSLASVQTSTSDEPVKSSVDEPEKKYRSSTSEDDSLASVSSSEESSSGVLPIPAAAELVNSRSDNSKSSEKSDKSPPNSHHSAPVPTTTVTAAVPLLALGAPGPSPQVSKLKGKSPLPYNRKQSGPYDPSPLAEEQQPAEKEKEESVTEKRSSTSLDRRHSAEVVPESPKKSRSRENKSPAPNEVSSSQEVEIKSSKSPRSRRTKELKRVDSSEIKETLESKYKLGAELGKGAFSTVRAAVNKKTGEKVAVKIIQKKFIKKDLIDREIDVMRSIDPHPSLLKLYEVFDTERNLYLVLELVEGGELFERILQKGEYTEKDAAAVIEQVLEGVRWLHDRHIVHRDLKPQNILVDADNRIKLADFGLARWFEGAGLLETCCGSPEYVAPEVLEGNGYDESCDIWAIGVITYILLTGCFPFYSQNAAQLYAKIRRGSYEWPAQPPISNEAKAFVKGLLQKDAKARPTAAECLENPWVKGRFLDRTKSKLSLTAFKGTLKRQAREKDSE